MNQRQLKQANIENLSNLWKLMGVRSYSIEGHDGLHASVAWPNRIWLDWKYKTQGVPALIKWAVESDNQPIVPIWDSETEQQRINASLLSNQGFTVFFEQTAMVLKKSNRLPNGLVDLQISIADSESHVASWTEVASQAFAYTIDLPIIQKIATDPHVQLIMAYIDKCPVATGLIFENAHVIGIYFVGVLAAYRGRGIARQILRYIIRESYSLNSAYLTLQASALGENLYLDLGFKRQFIITNYSNSDQS